MISEFRDDDFSVLLADVPQIIMVVCLWGLGLWGSCILQDF